MRNEMWIFVCTMTGFAFYIFGLWRGNKDAKRKDEELKRTRDSALRWESDAHNNRNLLYMEQRSWHVDKLCLERENGALKTENGKLKKQYADELQKRLELAELVKKCERGKEAVDETIEHVKSEVGCGEVPAGY